MVSSKLLITIIGVLGVFVFGLISDAYAVKENPDFPFSNNWMKTYCENYWGAENVNVENCYSETNPDIKINWHQLTEQSCPLLNGTWKVVTLTRGGTITWDGGICKIEGDVTIKSDDFWYVPGKTMLRVMPKAMLTNEGIIATDVGLSFIDNYGTLMNEDTGIIYLNSQLVNHRMHVGAFTAASVMDELYWALNVDIEKFFSALPNSNGKIFNDGIISIGEHGRLINVGLFENSLGVIQSEGSIKNSGTIIVNGDFVNNGFVKNSKRIELWGSGNFINDCKGMIQNHESSSSVSTGKAHFENKGTFVGSDKISGDTITGKCKVKLHTFDLLIGAPSEAIGIKFGGAFNLLYGGLEGLQTKDNDKMYFQSYVPIDESPEDGDFFGASFATGDFNGDTFMDAVVGVPGEDEDAGIVYVFEGTEKGLSDVYQTFWQGKEVKGAGEIQGSKEPGDEFGYSLAAGNFNGDDFDDLAIGSPNEKIGTIESGAVNVFYGGKNGLNTIDNDEMYYLGREKTSLRLFTPEGGEEFGYSLAAGKFTRGDKDALFVGAPGAKTNGKAGGAVFPLFTSALPEKLYQGAKDGFFGGSPEDKDRFGHSVAISKDSMGFLAIGAPGEVLDTKKGGAVFWVCNYCLGTVVEFNPFLHQGSHKALGAKGDLESGDAFGSSLVFGDFNDDGRDDLAIGSPGESIGDITNAGILNILLAESNGYGLNLNTDPIFFYVKSLGQDPKPNDLFGWSLASGDSDGDGTDDLAVGIPGLTIYYKKDSGPLKTVDSAGGVGIIRGTVDSGLDKNKAKVYSQFVYGVEGIPETGDEFGTSLAFGAFGIPDGDDIYIDGKMIHSKEASTVIQQSVSGGLVPQAVPPGLAPEPQTKASVMPPYKQIASGVAPDQVACKEGLTKTTRVGSERPLCVTSETLQNLIEMGIVSE